MTENSFCKDFVRTSLAQLDMLRVKAPKVLIVEDDLTLAFFIRKKLERLRCSVQVVDNGNIGFDLAVRSYYKLIILDVNLPEIDGFSILKRIRSRHLKTPVIVITGNNQEVREIVGYEMGANIFHPKPINFPLFEAQVKSALLISQPSPWVKIGDIELEPAANKLIKDGKDVEITQKELTLIMALLENRGNVLSRQDILRITYKGPRESSESSVDTLVSRLRKKLGNWQNKPIIETIHGRGYRLNPDLFLCDESF